MFVRVWVCTRAQAIICVHEPPGTVFGHVRLIRVRALVVSSVDRIGAAGCNPVEVGSIPTGVSFRWDDYSEPSRDFRRHLRTRKNRRLARQYS